MFATGIENSIPTIKGGRVRVDQMEACGHYKHWRTDFDLVEDMGIRFLRYGPPLHTSLLGAGKYDWSFADQAFAELRKRDIVPIVDLCHFGVPDWIGNFQNPDFPEIFEATAGPSPHASRGCSSIHPSTRCTFAPPSRPSTAGGTSS
jgi:beta-glucosidase/6-phospho-beta-glucosidase/beta-galactosidase